MKDIEQQKPAPLPTEWKKSGFQFRIIRREGDTVIVEKWRPETPSIVSYEVAKIRIQEEHTWPNGITTPRRECYPSSEHWGIYGFTCTTREQAQRRFNALT